MTTTSIEALLRAREMTVAELSSVCGCSGVTIRNIMAGKHSPNVLLALRIANALNVEVSHIWEAGELEAAG